MRGRYIGDFFSSSGGVSRQVRLMGFQAREWERLHGEHADLTRPYVLRKVEKDASRGKLMAAMLSPPCGSFSAINRFAGRSHADVWASNVEPQTHT